MEGLGITEKKVVKGLLKRWGTNSVVTADIHMQKNESARFPYTINKNELKMDQTPKCRARCKSRNYITHMRKQE